MVIGIDMGHPLNCGANKYLNETTENRKIGNRLISILKRQGHTVVNCTVDSNAGNELYNRVTIANRYDLDLYVSIHLNAGGGVGTETYYTSTTKSVAQRVNDNIVRSCGFRNRGLKTSSLYVLRNTKAPAILIEVCFVDSQEDANKLDCDKVASAIAAGITGKAIEEVKEKEVNINAIATSRCIVKLTDADGSGMLDPLELCEIFQVEPGTFRRTVRYYGWDRIKEGTVEEGSVYMIKDAYNYYSIAKENLEAYKDESLTEKEGGLIYPQEQICVGSINNGIAHVRFDSYAEGKLRHEGYIEAKYLCKIGEEPKVEDYLYVVKAETKNQEEAVALRKEAEEKGFNASLETKYLG